MAGRCTHTAILARSLGMPAIVGVHNARRLLQEDEEIIVDGEPGHAIASPDAGALSFYAPSSAGSSRAARR